MLGEFGVIKLKNNLNLALYFSRMKKIISTPELKNTSLTMIIKDNISLYQTDDASDIEYDGVRDDAEAEGSLLEATKKSRSGRVTSGKIRLRKTTRSMYCGKSIKAV